MRLIDLKCKTCATVVIDHFQRTSDEPLPACQALGASVPDASGDGGTVVPCGGEMERVFLPTGRGTVIGDDIPGGVDIKNGICHPDGSPRKFYSRSAIQRAAREAGYTNYVVHQPPPGSDKSKHTTRWT